MTALFVDGAAFSIGLRPYGRVDPAALVRWAEDIGGPLCCRYWFDATSEGAPNAFHAVAARAGFRLEICPTAPRTATDGTRSVKQVGVDVALAVAAIESRPRDGWSTLILAGGDGDFFPLAKELVERHGVRLILLSAPHATSPYLAAYATAAYDLMSLAPILVCHGGADREPTRSRVAS